MYKKIGFVGLGLIGGSIARTIKRKYSDTEIVAIDTDKDNINGAYRDGVISNAVTFPIEELGECDLIFLCAPVKTNVSLLPEIKKAVSDNALVTDVGSVKSVMEKAVAGAGLESQFIGGHPMCGSEKTGYVNSSDILLENVYYLITNNGKVDSQKVIEFEEFIESIGAIPLEMTPDEHDFVTGGVSHIPHIIAASLVNFVMNNDNDKHSMKTVAAGGFRDITRISSASPVMWQNICLTNKDKIIDLLDKYIDELKRFETSIEGSDDKEIIKLFEEAKEYRDSLSIGTDLITKSYEFYCDLKDEAGAIAKVATMLADNNLSIKNIGIINNREYRDGALRIEMYDEESKKSAIDILEKNDYRIYQ